MRSLPLPPKTIEAIRKAFYHSPKSIRAIAKENGLNYSSFYNWMSGFCGANCKDSDKFRATVKQYFNVEV